MNQEPRRISRTLSHWGAYDVETVGEDIKSIRPFHEDPEPSRIGQSMHDVARSRVLRPSVRRGWLDGQPGSPSGERGRGPFVEVSWDDALDIIADELERVRDTYGNQSVYAGSYGWASAGRFHHAQSQIHRFMNTIGGYTGSLNTYSLAAAEVILPHVIGYDWWTFENEQTAWKSIEENTELVVAFGGIPLKNSQVQYGGIGRHELRHWLSRWADHGTTFTNVSPLRSDLDASLDARWLPLRPGTDVAVMFGLMHTLVTENLHDLEFLSKYCIGWTQLEAYVLGHTDGVPKDVHWAARISSLNPDDIRDLARSMAQRRTLINLSWSLQRAHHGEQAVWAAIALAAALGQIGMPGGGFGIGYGAVGTIGNGAKKSWLPRFEQGEPALDSSIPVARLSDMLLSPGGAYSYDGNDFTYPDIRLVYWAGGNPFHHHQDLNKLRLAWQRPETIVVHEPFWTATAKHADIVLPATTPLERTDIGGAPNDTYLFAMHRALEPIGKSRNDFDIFAALADRLGAGHEFSEGRTASQWVRHLYDQLIEREPTVDAFDEFWRKGFLDRTEDSDADRVLLECFRQDPTAFPLATPSGRIELYSETISSFGYSDCPAHPTWLEPVEWLGSAQASFPLHLISNQPRTRLHSQWDHGRISRESKINGREPILINPSDAIARGISPDDIVRVFNRRGACLAGVKVTEDVRPGVVQLATGAWFDATDQPDLEGTCVHGNPNVLTTDIPTSRLAQGPSAQTCLVEIERFRGTPPPVTAYSAPLGISRTRS